jgi:hypothetical protein
MDTTEQRELASDEQAPRIEDSHIIFGDGHFRIPLEQCATYPAIVEWILFLAEQTWSSRISLRRFAHLALAHHKLETRRR